MLARIALGLMLLTISAAGSVGPGIPGANHLTPPFGNDLDAIRETLRLPRATVFNDQDGDKIFDTLEERYALAPLDAQRTIVLFRHGTDVTAGLARAQDTAGPIEPTHVFPQLSGFAAPLTLDQAQRLARLDPVRQIEWSQPGTPELDKATVSMGVRAVQSAFDISGDGDGVPQSFSGQDVTIAILDTGFDAEHVDLAGKFVAFYNAENRTIEEPFDSGNHGTHVASIAGGLGRGNEDLLGVAPGAAFVGIMIVGSDTKANAIHGMEWIVANKATYNIRISTISFGFGLTVDGTDALELAMDMAFEAGVLPFKSNGNSGPEERTTTIPGGARGIVSMGSMLDPMGSDAAPLLPDPVGPIATPRDYGFHISSYSSRGPTADGRIKPDLAAPGQSIMAALAGSGDGYAAFSGTSMASPFGAGVAALVLDADPGLAPSQVRQVLYDTAEDWGVEGPDIDYGYGRVNALLAVQTALVTRLARENAPYEELERVAAVEGPILPLAAHGTLNGEHGTQTVQVEDVSHPMALTLLYTGVTNPIGGSARVVIVQLRGPDDLVAGRFALSPTSRQQMITFQPTSAGPYVIEILNPTAGGAGAGYDVSAGLPPPEVLPSVVLPESGPYEAERGRALGASDAPAEAVPGFGVGLVVVALLSMSWFVRGRRRRTEPKP